MIRYRLRMEANQSEGEWAKKCAKIADLAKYLGLTTRFYSPTVFVVCSPDGGGTGETKAEKPSRARSGGDASDGSEGRSEGDGKVEGTLL